MDVTWLESPAPKSKQFGMLAASDVVISEGRAFTEIPRATRMPYSFNLRAFN